MQLLFAPIQVKISYLFSFAVPLCENSSQSHVLTGIWPRWGLGRPHISHFLLQQPFIIIIAIPGILLPKLIYQSSAFRFNCSLDLEVIDFLSWSSDDYCTLVFL